MRVPFLGLEISRTKAPSQLNAVSAISQGGWWPVVREPFAGAWQKNRSLSRDSVMRFHAVYACTTLIAADVSKCRCRVVEQGTDGIWREVQVAAFSPVLRKPNRYQNRIQFFENWIISKLTYGNTYVLKERDARQVVKYLYVLDPTRTKPLVAPDGEVFYQLSADNLSGIEGDTIVPASEIIHDRHSPLFHPLIGISPIMACGLGASQGLAIQNHSASLFTNGSQPGGILTAPGRIGDDDAQRIKDRWEQNFSGDNVGRVAILGMGLEYKTWAVNAVDAQLIEQLKWSALQVCSTYGVPAYKVQVDVAPTYNNIEALDQQYYSQCIQRHFEQIELCLDEGLGLVDTAGHTYGTEFDLDDLIRMDTSAKIRSVAEAVRASVMGPNEGRARLNLPPVEGGDTPYIQQQNWPLSVLAKRPPPTTAPPAATGGGGAGDATGGGGGAGFGAAALIPLARAIFGMLDGRREVLAIGPPPEDEEPEFVADPEDADLVAEMLRDEFGLSAATSEPA